MMTLAGVDLYIWTKDYENIPKKEGKFTMKLMSNRGTKLYPPPAPEMDMIDWFRCRFVSEEVINDADVDQLCQALTSAGWVWNKAQKLYQIDGINAYSEPY